MNFGPDSKSVIFTQEVISQIDDLETVIVSTRQLGLMALRVPAGLESLSNSTGRLQLAPIQIEDLLGRSSRKIDLGAIRSLIEGRRVVVTGAGGSIGSELCRQIAGMEPGSLMLLDHSEFALYTIAKELRADIPNLRYTKVSQVSVIGERSSAHSRPFSQISFFMRQH
jgi:FlaA1/EpsC-like NDP-sugar epimerase